MIDGSLLGKVFLNPPQIDPDIVEQARKLGVATIAAATKEPWPRFHLVDPEIQRVAGAGATAGTAVTCWNPPGNNTMVRFLIEGSRAGDFLVLSTPIAGAAQWGDLAHDWAVARGAVGVLVEGSVRDLDVVRQNGLPLWARSIDPRQALKDSPGYVNAPVPVGGVVIEPGDLVVADGDGVVAIPWGEAEAVIERASNRAREESLSREDLVRGQVSPHLAGIFDADAIVSVAHTWRNDHSA